MTPKKGFYGMLGLLGAIILLSGAGYYFGIGILQDRATAISDAKADRQLVEQQLEIYEDSKRKVEEFSFVNDLAAKVLPEEKDQALAVAQLREFAVDNNTSIQQISFGGGEVADDPNLTQTSFVTGINGVRVISANLLIAPGVGYENFINFLEDIENNQRKMQVIGVSIAPDPSNPSALSSASVDINIFLKGS